MFYSKNLLIFQKYSSLIFLLAIINMIFASFFHKLGNKIIIKNNKKLSFSFFIKKILYIFGETEYIFALWSIPLGLFSIFLFSYKEIFLYLYKLNYIDIIFVILIVTISSNVIIINFFEKFLYYLVNFFSDDKNPKYWWFAVMTIGPILGSFITEPAAITITSTILFKKFFILKPSQILSYLTLGLLLVNTSVGGALTNFAAPPILIVSRKWKWSSLYTFKNFGLKILLGIILINIIYINLFKKEFNILFKKNKFLKNNINKNDNIFYLIIYIIFLILSIFFLHNIKMLIILSIFFYIFNYFIGYHKDLKIKNSIKVGIFLWGLMLHGGLQVWWIEPLLTSIKSKNIFIVSLILTTFNDNASITYLASQVSEFCNSKYLQNSVVAGAIIGGGLTVMANAPNPIAIKILEKFFNKNISFYKLFFSAIIPTILYSIIFLLI